MILLQKP